MKKAFEIPAMKVVEVKKQDMICTSPVASVNVTMDGTFEEEDI